MEGTIQGWQIPTQLFQLPAVIKANTTIAIIAKAIATSRSGGFLPNMPGMVSPRSGSEVPESTYAFGLRVSTGRKPWKLNRVYPGNSSRSVVSGLGLVHCSAWALTIRS